MNGRLVYVVGPSGAGKDSLIEFARGRLSIEDRVIFARRFITRAPAASGEQHVAVTPEHFMYINDLGGFSLAWEANGHRYGIGNEIRNWLSWGFQVVVNGSREYLSQVRRGFPGLVTVHITAPADLIHQRLVDRKRESPDRIAERLRRSAAWELSDTDGVLTIVNDGNLAIAGEQLIALLREHAISNPIGTTIRDSSGNASSMGS